MEVKKLGALVAAASADEYGTAEVRVGPSLKGLSVTTPSPVLDVAVQPKPSLATSVLTEAKEPKVVPVTDLPRSRPPLTVAERSGMALRVEPKTIPPPPSLAEHNAACVAERGCSATHALSVAEHNAMEAAKRAAWGMPPDKPLTVVEHNALITAWRGRVLATRALSVAEHNATEARARVLAEQGLLERRPERLFRMIPQLARSVEAPLAQKAGTGDLLYRGTAKHSCAKSIASGCSAMSPSTSSTVRTLQRRTTTRTPQQDDDEDLRSVMARFQAAGIGPRELTIFARVVQRPPTLAEAIRAARMPWTLRSGDVPTAETRVILGTPGYQRVHDTTRFPASAILRVGAGTGAMVGRRVAITCAHVVFNKSDPHPDNPNQEVFCNASQWYYMDPLVAAGSRNADMPFGDARIVARYVPYEYRAYQDPQSRADYEQTHTACPGQNMWSTKGHLYDFAALLLDRNLGDLTGYFQMVDLEWLIDALLAQRVGASSPVFNLAGMLFQSSNPFAAGFRPAEAIIGKVTPSSRTMDYVRGPVLSFGYPDLPAFVRNNPAPTLDPLLLEPMSRDEMYAVSGPFERTITREEEGVHLARTYIDCIGGQSGSPLLVRDLSGQLAACGVNPWGGVPTESVLPKQDWLQELAAMAQHGASEPVFTENYEGWTSLGTQLASNPVTAVVREAGRMDVFVRGTDNHVYRNVVTWVSQRRIWNLQGWQDLGGQSYDPPAAVSRGPELLDIFIRDSNGRVATQSIRGGPGREQHFPSERGWSTVFDWDTEESPTAVEVGGGLALFARISTGEVRWGEWRADTGWVDQGVAAPLVTTLNGEVVSARGRLAVNVFNTAGDPGLLLYSYDTFTLRILRRVRRVAGGIVGWSPWPAVWTIHDKPWGWCTIGTPALIEDPNRPGVFHVFCTCRDFTWRGDKVFHREDNARTGVLTAFGAALPGVRATGDVVPVWLPGLSKGALALTVFYRDADSTWIRGKWWDQAANEWWTFHPDAQEPGGTMIDVKATVTQDVLWLIARGMNQKVYCRPYWFA